MNEIPFYSRMAVPVAEQRSNRREPIQLSNPGIVLRTLASKMRSVFETFEQSLTAASKEATFCEYHPAECRGIA